MKAKDPQYRDLMRDGIASSLKAKGTPEEAELALAFVGRAVCNGQETAAAGRHIAEALGLVETVKGRIWDPAVQAFAPYVQARRKSKFGEIAS